MSDKSDEMGGSLLAHAFFADAKVYARGAQLLTVGDTGLPLYPANYFLWCHAIELSLKALLILNGWSAKECRNKIGHDLAGAAKRGREFGFSLNENHQRNLEFLSILHDDTFVFRYRPASMYAFPNPDVMRELATEIIARVDTLFVKPRPSSDPIDLRNP